MAKMIQVGVIIYRDNPDPAKCRTEPIMMPATKELIAERKKMFNRIAWMLGYSIFPEMEKNGVI